MYPSELLQELPMDGLDLQRLGGLYMDIMERNLLSLFIKALDLIISGGYEKSERGITNKLSVSVISFYFLSCLLSPLGARVPVFPTGRVGHIKIRPG